MEDEEEEARKRAIKAAFSERFESFQDSLLLLYIKNNLSGRNKFREKWPHAANYVFGPELVNYDDHGVTDRNHRSNLEEEAENRRIDILNVIDEATLKSVKSGSLEFEYIGGVLDHFGPDISRLIYAENIIERVRPGMLKDSGPADTGSSYSSDIPEDLNFTVADDIDDNLKPIETSVPKLAPENLPQEPQEAPKAPMQAEQPPAFEEDDGPGLFEPNAFESDPYAKPDQPEQASVEPQPFSDPDANIQDIKAPSQDAPKGPEEPVRPEEQPFMAEEKPSQPEAPPKGYYMDLFNKVAA
ncbi:MAG: hypothetical protein KDI13_05795 [Alphaproteobacteria bacterium]|nr:hypothetical protein [Alphaproteobacteria bacterium]